MAKKTDYYPKETKDKNGNIKKRLYVSNFELATPADKEAIKMYMDLGYKLVVKKETTRKKMPSDKLNKDYILQICREDKLKCRVKDEDGKTEKIIPAEEYFYKEFEAPSKFDDGSKNEKKQSFLSLKKEFLELLKNSIKQYYQDNKEKYNEYKAEFDKKGKDRIDILYIRDKFNKENYPNEEKLKAADIK